MTRTEIKFLAGTHIDDVALELWRGVMRTGWEHWGRFNDGDLRCLPGDTVKATIARYREEDRDRREAYVVSPAGQARAHEAVLKHAQRQRDTDALLRRLPRVFAGGLDHEVLRWLCEWQQAADWLDIIRDEESVLARFEAFGYRDNMCVGPDYVETSRHISFCYLVGQGMAGIRSVGTPHGIIHKFAEQWRQRFAPGVERFSALGHL